MALATLPFKPTNTPQPCRRCDVPTLPQGTPLPEGHAIRAGRRCCKRCYDWLYRNDRNALLAMPTCYRDVPEIVTAKPTPDCRRCKRPTLSAKIPRRQRPKGVPVHKSRGLCTTCHGWLTLYSPDELLDYERLNRSSADVLEDYEVMRKAYGGNLRQIAERMKIDPRTLYQAMYRTRRREQKRQQETLAPKGVAA